MSNYCIVHDNLNPCPRCEIERLEATARKQRQSIEGVIEILLVRRANCAASSQSDKAGAYGTAINLLLEVIANATNAKGLRDPSDSE